MKSRALSKREKRLLKITAAVIAASLFIYIFLNVFSKLEDANKEIKEKEFVLFKYLAALSVKDVISLEEQDKAVFTERGQDTIYNELSGEIEKLAGNSSVKIERIKTLPVQMDKGYGKFFLEIEAGGDFTSLFQLISNLETSPLFIKVSSCRFYPQGRADLPLRCRIVIFKVFFT